ncbi:zinc-dependent metalloprotease [Marinicella marina]|uniref:zinc-dependent metalloprotease n=1 Tax=Marinicella marina TaxID=2996016 RepID=UPI002260EC92|nr:zinc-dependent metalloprotease [Marinicella marina]MDJ1140228.1 zinc-dependent metalloprotease [Marinicella marina]
MAEEKQDAPKDISGFTEKMVKKSGFIDFYWDENKGKIYLEIDQFNQDLLYAYFLQSGLGSNDVGLDRGQIGGYALVQFKRLGNKVMMIEPNQAYRAFSDNPAERQAVADGFAQSVLWGGEVVASSSDAVLVDWTAFLTRDSQGISERLETMKEGQFKLDEARSAIVIESSKNFPQNTELSAMITLEGKKPGRHVRSVTPAGNIISLKTHHSLIQLPEEPYQPRAFDPRSGAIPISFKDYAAPLSESMNKQWVIRHRLEKQDPTAAISDAVEPIVYYLDPGTPEPVRSALLEGAKWWQAAFEAAGYSNAYRVELLPEGADPLDIRYNTIQWVHRSTRGWSYGASIVDPRSGEILKGHVTLGSLRVRQDMLIAQGLLSPYDGEKNTQQLEQDIEQMALARLRQLSAHEVGHTIGLIHNFYASSKDRASVMDYPHPLVKLNESGEIDLNQAYDVGIGDWDKVSLAYIYQDFGNQDETAGLNQLLQQAKRDGHVFIADRDARAAGGSHPYSHLWDNGKDAAQSLLDVLQIRSTALSNFGLDTIQPGQTVASLEKYLVPIYLFHRYQTEAAVKLIAGVDYRYAIKGEEQVAATIVDAATQQKALSAVLKTLDVKTLALPQELLPLLLPPVEGSYRDREHFKHRTGLNFDALGVAETAAQNTLKFLLNPQRINRLIEHHARDQNMPSLNTVLEQLWQSTWQRKHKNDYHLAVQQGINWTTLEQLMHATTAEELSPLARSQMISFLQQKQKSLAKKRSHKAFNGYAAKTIGQFIKNPKKTTTQSIKPMPPGSPIGMN